MAQKTLSELVEVSVVNDSDVLLVEKSSSTNKVTKANLFNDYATKNYVQAQISNAQLGGSGSGSSTLSWYNAKSYGAKGDGSTDDSTALNALIRKVHDAGGGVIYCPKGVYVLKEQMNWLSGVSLIGDGVGCTIFKTVRNGATYDVSHSAIGYDAKNGYGIADGEPFYNCHFRDFEIDGSGIVSTDGHYCVRIKGIYMQYLVNCTFDNLYIHDTMATGLGVDYLDKSYITNVTVKNCGRGYEVLTGGSLGGAGIGIGTGAMESENLVISNCIADGNGHYGIFLEHQKLFESTLNYEAQGVTISNCISKNNRYYGIGVRGGMNVIIDSCQSYDNQKHGIYCYTLDINDLTISNCQIFGNKGHGVFVYSLLIDGLKIHNNTFLNNDQDIRFQSLKTGTGNVMIDSNYFKNSKVGIQIECPNNPDYLVIQDNMFVGCQELGISVQDGNQYVISSLFIKNNVFKDIGTTSIVGKAICLWVDGQVGEITNNTFHKKKSDISMNGVHFISCKLTKYRIKNNYFTNCDNNYIQQNSCIFNECDNEFSQQGLDGSNGGTGGGLTTEQVQQLQQAHTHSTSPHAPSNAQRNSDITKAEIEAKLTGDVSTHTHNEYTGGKKQRFLTQQEYNNLSSTGQLDSNTVYNITDAPVGIVIKKVTQQQYDTESHDANTLYVIVG